MNISKQQQGELLVAGSAALWGLFPVITVLSYNTVSPLISLTISSMFAAVFFAIIITTKKIWYQLLNWSAYKDILLATLFLGVVYYLLVFLALKFTSPGNAAIVGLTGTFFSFLFFHVFRRERIPKHHIFGALIIVFGAFIILLPNMKVFHLGDLLILLAVAIAPFGFFFTQRARKRVDSETIMLIRSILSAGVIFLLALSFRTPIVLSSIQHSLLFLLINGCLLFGLSKTLLINGIHRISVTKANALESGVAPLITLLSAWLLLKQQPTPWQFFSFLPIYLGVILLNKKSK